MRWSKEEISLLKENFYSTPKDELLKVFSDRTWESIRKKAGRIGLSRKRLNEPDNLWEIDDVPSWFEGELISDGCIDTCGRYTHTSKYKEYIELLDSKFDNYGVNARTGNNSYYDERTNKKYNRFTLRTRNLFKNLREVWYTSKKIVPDEFSINGESLVHWVIGDGTINKDGNRFALCTHGFSDRDIDKLKKKFCQKGIKVTSNSNNGLIIWRTEENKEIIKDMLGGNISEFPTCYYYKKDRLLEWMEY